MYVKKNDAEELIPGRGKLIVMLCDVKEKEEKIKCVTEHRNGNIITKGNIGIKDRNEACDKSISEVIRNIDSRRNSEEYIQNKHGSHL